MQTEKFTICLQNRHVKLANKILDVFFSQQISQNSISLFADWFVCDVSMYKLSLHSLPFGFRQVAKTSQNCIKWARKAPYN